MILKQYDLVYIPQRAVKGQALADFLVDHPIIDDWELKSIFYLHEKCILIGLQDVTVLVQE